MVRDFSSKSKKNPSPNSVRFDLLRHSLAQRKEIHQAKLWGLQFLHGLGQQAMAWDQFLLGPWDWCEVTQQAALWQLDLFFADALQMKNLQPAVWDSFLTGPTLSEMQSISIAIPKAHFCHLLHPISRTCRTCRTWLPTWHKIPGTLRQWHLPHCRGVP